MKFNWGEENEGWYVMLGDNQIAHNATPEWAEKIAESLNAGEVISGLENAVRFLAKQERSTYRIRSEAMLMLHHGDIEGAKDLLCMKWPIVQGTSNQMDLEKVGKQDCDYTKIRAAIDHLLGRVCKVDDDPSP